MAPPLAAVQAVGVALASEAGDGLVQVPARRRGLVRGDVGLEPALCGHGQSLRVGVRAADGRDELGNPGRALNLPQAVVDPAQVRAGLHGGRCRRGVGVREPGQGVDVGLAGLGGPGDCIDEPQLGEHVLGFCVGHVAVDRGLHAVRDRDGREDE